MIANGRFIFSGDRLLSCIAVGLFEQPFELDIFFRIVFCGMNAYLSIWSLDPAFVGISSFG